MDEEPKGSLRESVGSPVESLTRFRGRVSGSDMAVEGTSETARIKALTAYHKGARSVTAHDFVSHKTMAEICHVSILAAPNALASLEL